MKTDKMFTPSQQHTLQLAFAATLAALSRGKVPIGPAHQRLLHDAWNLVKDPSDPVLTLTLETRRTSEIVLPFNESYSV